MGVQLEANTIYLMAYSAARGGCFLRAEVPRELPAVLVVKGVHVCSSVPPTHKL